MSLSSDSCLKRIRQYVERAGYKEVSEERVREACLSNNFCPKDAANQLIKEEQLKIYLEDMCVRLGYQPIKAFISTSCTKYKFAQEQVEKYTLKLFEAKSKVLSECIKENLTTPDESELNKLILFYFGNWKVVLHNIREGL
jgi:hypothetical protein